MPEPPVAPLVYELSETEGALLLGSAARMLTGPRRIQRSRAKGWRMPEGAIYVGRTAGHSTWANPFQIGGYFKLGGEFGPFPLSWMQSLVSPPEPGYTRIVDRQMAVDWFRLMSAKWPPAFMERCRRELGGHDLCCWCPLVDAAGKPVPCHADVLLELANA